jgi:peptide/nickel transport system permease protein
MNLWRALWLLETCPKRDDGRTLEIPMSAYVLRRLVAVVPVLFGVSVVAFVLMKLIPGDIALAMSRPDATAQELHELRESLGLNAPLPVQYVLWLGRVLQGDFGYSVSEGRPVLDVLLPRLQNTAILTLAALFVSSTVGATLGILSAVRQGSALDRLAMVLALLGNSMPVFWLGLILILVFGLGLGMFPIGGMYSSRGDGGVGDLAHHLVLPALTLGAASAGLVARMSRSAMLEVLRQDYVRTAHAKGLRARSVLGSHTLRNAAVPVITVLGLQLGYLLGGSVITETVFSWPGIGFAMNAAIARRDVPVVQGAVLISATLFVFINLAVDLGYALIDPRIKYGSARG